jgi:rhamnosyltransferase
MKVSVIIPTLNGGRYLGQLLCGLRRQSVKPSQILVVDSSSNDDTVEICKSFASDIIQIAPEAFDHGGTRNLAASRARGDILVYLTQDASFKDTQSLENLVSPLYESVVAASYGRHIPRDDADPVERFSKLYNYPSVRVIKGMDDLPELGVKTFFFSNVCSAINRRAFEEIGGFPTKIIRNEDMFLAAKLLNKGYRIAYQPDASVYHSHSYSLVDQFKRYFDIGVFFNRNRWIRDLASSEKEGIKYLKEEFRFLAANGQLRWIPYALVDTMARFLGYRIGLLEKGIPLGFKKRISYNRDFWEAADS